MKQEKQIIWTDAVACHFAGYVAQSIKMADKKWGGFDMQQILDEYKDEFGVVIDAPKP